MLTTQIQRNGDFSRGQSKHREFHPSDTFGSQLHSNNISVPALLPNTVLVLSAPLTVLLKLNDRLSFLAAFTLFISTVQRTVALTNVLWPCEFETTWIQSELERGLWLLLLEYC